MKKYELLKGTNLSAAIAFIFLIVSILAGTYSFIFLMQGYAPSIGSYDFPIFLHHAKMFIDTEQLYLPDPVKYYPAAPIYKFPPFFACILINLLQLNLPEISIYKIFFYLQMFLYASTISASILYISRFIKIQNKSKKMIFYGVSFLVSATFIPFFETLMPLQLESYILALLTLAVCLLLNEKNFLAGLAVGAACALKVYPLIFIFYFALRRNWLAISGFLTGLFVITLYTILVIGADTHIFYFTKILPVMMNEYPSEALTNISLAANMRHFYEYYQPYFSSLDEMPIKMLFRIQFLVFLIPAAWLIYSNSSNFFKTDKKLLVGFSLFMILALMGLIDSWDNYQLLLLAPIIIFLNVIFSSEKIDSIALAILLVSILVLFITAYPSTREKIPVSYIYQYVVYRGLTTYFIYYVGFRLLSQLYAKQSSH